MIWVKNGDTWARIKPLPITAMVSAPNTVPTMVAAPAEQIGAAQHHRGDHLQLKTDPGVARARCPAGQR